jgi:hypothetical protein
MRRHRYIRTVGIFVATVISLIAAFAFLKDYSGKRANRDSDLTVTGSIPTKPVARPPSVQLIQARSNDPMAALLVEPRSQSIATPRETVPLPRPRPNRL